VAEPFHPHHPPPPPAMTTTPGQNVDGPTRCVTLAEAKGEVPAALATLLSDRGWQVIAFNDPYLAMAELCLLDRSDSARRACGLPATPAAVLVVVVPDGSDTARAERDQLADAVRHHVATTAILAWNESDGTLLELSPGVPSPAAPAPPANRPAPPARLQTAPREAPLRLVDSGEPAGEMAGDPPDLADTLRDDDDEPAPRITREEIEMLFGTGATEEPAP